MLWVVVTLIGALSLLSPAAVRAEVGTYYPGLDDNEPDQCLPPAHIDSGDDDPDEDLETFLRCSDPGLENAIACEAEDNANETLVNIELDALCWLRDGVVFEAALDEVTRDQCVVASAEPDSRPAEDDLAPNSVQSVCCQEDAICKRLLNDDVATCVRVVNAPDNQVEDLGFCDTPKRLGSCRNPDGTIDSAQLRRCFTQERDDSSLERTTLADGDCDRDGVRNRDDCALCDATITARRGTPACEAVDSNIPAPSESAEPVDAEEPIEVPLIDVEAPGFRGGGGCHLGLGAEANGWALLLAWIARRRKRHARMTE